MGSISPRRLGSNPPEPHELHPKRATDTSAEAVDALLRADDLEEHARGKLRAALVRLFRPQDTLSAAEVAEAVSEAEAYFLRLRAVHARKPEPAPGPARMTRRAPVDPERRAHAEQVLAMPAAARILPAHGFSREFVEHFSSLLADERDGKRDPAPLADREARLLGVARILGIV